jgi:glucose-1-phosphatase
VIKAVVFDMDGVLCRYRIERRLALLASWSGQSSDAIHAAVASAPAGSCGAPRPSMGGYVTGTGPQVGCPPPEGVDVDYPLWGCSPRL